MGERTSHAPGTFSWADLATTDADAAKAFYGQLFGWALEDQPVPGAPPYTLAKIDGRAVAALYQRQTEQADPPAWLSYVTVESADKAASRTGELGGNAISAPFDVLDAGRMAVLQDPTGAVFGVWQPHRTIGAELVNDPGAMTMNQLNTGDPDTARTFYEALFAWRFEELAGGDQPFWSIYNGDRLNGGMMPSAESGSPAHWLVYFTVEDLDGSVARVAEGGGRVLVQPMPIPAGRLAVAQDPQGATFAFFEGEVDD